MKLNAYIGWTGENALAYEVCRASLLAKASVPVEVYPLRHWELRTQGIYARPYRVRPDGQRLDGVDGSAFSTDFSFTRFLVPALENYERRWALYCDSDMLWLDDVRKLLAEVEHSAAPLACVQHPPLDTENRKMVGQSQTPYARKNWSSLMLMHGARCRALTADYVSEVSGAALHQFRWLNGTEPAALPARWNVLHGKQSDPDPAVVHFTLGTPDMPFRAPDDEWSELWWRCARVLEAGRVKAVQEILS